MELPPPEPTEPTAPEDTELQRPPVCAVPDRRTTRQQAAALERERRELAALQAQEEEEEEEIDIDKPAPDEDVSFKRADLRAINKVNIFRFSTVSSGRRRSKGRDVGRSKGRERKVSEGKLKTRRFTIPFHSYMSFSL